MNVIILNGKRISADQAGLSAGDRGLLYGDGLFETMRVERGAPLFLEGHLDRLEEGSRVLRFASLPEREELRAGVVAAVRSNGVYSGYLRLTVTRGVGGFGTPLARLDQPSYWVEAREHPLDLRRYDRGISAATVSIRRNPASPLCRVKSLNYLESVLAREEAVGLGADEALFLTTEGDVCEGASANLFIVHKGRLITPDLTRGPLPGTVRRWVVENAARLGFPVKERWVEREEVFEAEGVFFTNSTWGPFPCVEVDGSVIGTGKPDPITRQLIRQWRVMIEAIPERGDRAPSE
ncbi:aminotransferase class IV [Paludifilum halophilum]|uniref:4-amino-4-deoxychorismate lyase n=1 Tax=Paludifilum halophilum TaxID=1642702 RepID=A0A235B5E2_9BACL|nr:aminotransferase class IV [Paludifilum halophilum]OYD07451.1 hypothetical protein CHM34_11150 [Paludifilum halophilum]